MPRAAPPKPPSLDQVHQNRRISSRLHNSPLFNPYPGPPVVSPPPKLHALSQSTFTQSLLGLSYTDLLEDNTKPQPQSLHIPSDQIIDPSSLNPTPDAEATPLEKSMAACVILRNNYLTELKRLVKKKRNFALLNDDDENLEDLTESTEMLLTDVADLLTLLRHATVEFIEALSAWRESHKQVSERSERTLMKAKIQPQLKLTLNSTQFVFAPSSLGAALDTIRGEWQELPGRHKQRFRLFGPVQAAAEGERTRNG